jgi:hypothetical protein
MIEPLSLINMIVIFVLAFSLDKNFDVIKKRLDKLEKDDD